MLHAMTRVAPYTALFGHSPNEPSSSLLDAAPSIYTYDHDEFLTSLHDRLQRSWRSCRAGTAEQQEKQREFEHQKLSDLKLQVGDWVFENNPTLENCAKCGKLSLPYCGPYQAIELNRNACMAKLEVLRGRDKWVHMRWLSHCDMKMLECKCIEPWYGNYKEHCSLQAIPDEEEPMTGDNVSTGDQFSQLGRGASEKRHSPEERLRQKLKESESSVDYSKFEPDSPDFDEKGTELTDKMETDDVSFQSTPNDSGEEEEQSVQQPGAAPIEERLTPKSRRCRPFKRAKSKELFRSTERISSRTRSRSPQGAESDSSVVGAPIQTLSPELTQCCIQVLTAMVKPQLLELVDQLQTQVTVGTDCFRGTKMSGHGSRVGRGSDGRSSWSHGKASQEQREWDIAQQAQEKRALYQEQPREEERRKKKDKDREREGEREGEGKELLVEQVETGGGVRKDRACLGECCKEGGKAEVGCTSLRVRKL